MLTVGALLQYGKYRVDEVLAVKGSSVTYRATHNERQQPVAIKTALTEPVAADVEIGRFLAEARRIAQLDHPHIAKVDDCFVEENRLFLVTDFIFGQSLSQKLCKGPLPVADALRYIRQIGQAIALMHQKGLLHQDIKPSNIMVSEDAQRATLIDFNLARTLSPREAPVNLESLCTGFVPPEPFVSPQLWTAAADIYGLAATLYALVTGKIPAPVHSAKSETPSQTEAPLIQVPQLEQAISKGMAFDIRDRPASLLEWLALLPDELSETGVFPTTKGQSIDRRELADAEKAQTVLALQSDLDPLAPTPVVPKHSPNFQPKTVHPKAQAPQGEMTRQSPKRQSSTQHNEQTRQIKPTKQTAPTPASAKPRTGFPVKTLLLSAAIAGIGGAGLGFVAKTQLIFPTVLPSNSSILMPSQNIEESFPPKGPGTIPGSQTASPQTGSAAETPLPLPDSNYDPSAASQDVPNPAPAGSGGAETDLAPSALPEPLKTPLKSPSSEAQNKASNPSIPLPKPVAPPAVPKDSATYPPTYPPTNPIPTASAEPSPPEPEPFFQKNSEFPSPASEPSVP
jgi:serine/threonine protein kinase